MKKKMNWNDKVRDLKNRQSMLHKTGSINANGNRVDVDKKVGSLPKPPAPHGSTPVLTKHPAYKDPPAPPTKKESVNRRDFWSFLNEIEDKDI